MIKTLILLGALATGTSAFAVSITGEIGMTGGATANNSDLTLATAITSFGIVTVTPGSTDGAYLGTDGSVVNYTPFTFSPVLSPDPVAPLWSFVSGGTTYKFALTSVYIDDASANSLTLKGAGIASISGGLFDDTEGNWVFTINRGNSKFTFSASNTVPDGGATAVLLGVGLLGLGCLRRKA